MTYDVVRETNIPKFSVVGEYDHEEAEMLLILLCHDVARRDLFSECVVFSPDADVFLLLIHHFLELTPCTLIRTGRGDQLHNINISKCYKTIGPVRATALLVFHALTGRYQTGRFNGKTKSIWWKQFYSAREDVLAVMADLGEGSCLLS